ncbi:MAG: ATP-binding cassette domain-containing protein, partial [Treponema sp.]|nr:ATP-binding cassette domain-containing protein [Treponema sp.]
MIELVDFSKSYSSKNDFAVKNINMICKDGEITGLLGLNGAGKTTILKAICGRHIATGGKVLIDGIDASENLEKARNITGF